MNVEVGRNKDGWEAAVNNVNLTEQGKELFRQDRLALYQMHRDIVYDYPKGVIDLGYSPICRVQGMYIPDKLLTVQGHPEFNQEIMEEIIATRHATGIFDDEAYEKHMKKVDLQVSLSETESTITLTPAIHLKRTMMSILLLLIPIS